jgi:hypothetical protein
MRLVQLKPVQGLFWAKEYRLLKIVPTGVETDIPLMQQLMHLLHIELPLLLLEPLNHCDLDMFVRLKSTI